MAVIGRQKSYLYFKAQAAMPASITALPSAKNILTSVSRPACILRQRNWANTAMCPGGNSDRGPSAQYSAVTFLRSPLGPLRLVSARAVSMSVIVLGGGGTFISSAARDGENDLMLPHCGVSGACCGGPGFVAGGVHVAE